MHNVFDSQKVSKKRNRWSERTHLDITNAIDERGESHSNAAIRENRLGLLGNRVQDGDGRIDDLKVCLLPGFGT